MGFTLQIHISLFSNSLRCPHPSWAFLFTWTISLSLDYVYIITGIQLFVKGLKESFLNITKNITLEGIEPSLFYSTTTKPPGADKSFNKGNRTLSLYSFKTNPSKTLLVVSLL